MFWLHRVVTCVVWVVVGIAHAEPANGRHPESKETLVSSTALYAARFAGPRRDSLVAVRTRAEGRVVSSHDLKLVDGELPRDLLVWQSLIVVSTSSTVSTFSGDDGWRWSRTKRAGSPAVAAGDRLFLIGRNSRLTAVSAGNEVVLADAPFPGLPSREYSVLQLWPKSDDFVSTTYVADPTFDEEQEDRPPPEPKVLAARTGFGRVLGAWTAEVTGELKLPPLLVPELDLWIAATDVLIVANYRTKQESPGVGLPLEDTVDWSADSQGQLCATGYTDGHKLVVAFTPEGKELWRWIDLDSDDRWATTQPPMRSADGRVIVLTEGRVLSLVAGRLDWTFDARSASLKHGALADEGSFEVKNGRLLSTSRLIHGTVLQDGSILVVGNRTIRHVDAKGKALFSTTLPEDILTPPVVDGDGSIFVATAIRLFKIR